VPSVFLPRHYHYTAVCVQYLLCHLCFFPATTSILEFICAQNLLCPVLSHTLPQSLCSPFFKPCSFPGTNNALHSICSVFTVPSVFLPRHYQYTAVHLCSGFTVPSVPSQALQVHCSPLVFRIHCALCSFPGTTSTLQSTCVQDSLYPLCPFPGTSRKLQSTCVQYLPRPLCPFPGTSRTLQSTCVQYLMRPLCPFPGTTTTLQSTCVEYLLCPVCFLRGTITTLQSISAHYLLCP
jgi:hypothetical protein